MHENRLYFDRCLAFGNRASAGIFCRFADLITWIANDYGIEAIIHYVDDFLILVTALQIVTAQTLRLFKTILNTLGVPYKDEKMEGPTNKITYLGIRLDSESMTAYAPEVKRHQIIQLLRPWTNRPYITLAKLQSIIGSLMWVTQVMPQGRIFIQALINKTKSKKGSGTKINLNRQCA